MYILIKWWRTACIFLGLAFDHRLSVAQTETKTPHNELWKQRSLLRRRPFQIHFSNQKLEFPYITSSCSFSGWKLAPLQTKTGPGRHYCDVIWELQHLKSPATSLFVQPLRTTMLRVTGPLWGNHYWLVDSPHKWPVTRKTLPCHNVIIYRHDVTIYLTALQWRHNDHDDVWNHQPHECLRNRLSRHR